ncbi:hypothetical protein NDU88_001148 [Pleurodeles waltl]|uniref:Uncharacterized protein n=1 Tax=Pleurodeles waltl TaxID=8319 RepID=A0AAV7LYU8_PLEWA|nr:hypothetical protein NDU88_001148 [Pleurodeles waltl]
MSQCDNDRPCALTVRSRGQGASGAWLNLECGGVAWGGTTNCSAFLCETTEVAILGLDVSALSRLGVFCGLGVVLMCGGLGLTTLRTLSTLDPCGA